MERRTCSGTPEQGTEAKPSIPCCVVFEYSSTSGFPEAETPGRQLSRISCFQCCYAVAVPPVPPCHSDCSSLVFFLISSGFCSSNCTTVVFFSISFGSCRRQAALARDQLLSCYAVAPAASPTGQFLPCHSECKSPQTSSPPSPGFLGNFFLSVLL